ncbi:hypothetical protein [Luteimonas arsenica]|uniref:hypothetical protein n=1 Tax=Luteimonas arsenica TaxID=1586242 RepID=UPI001055FBFA|nr:hypothetical protein [Luteimonas arsenica]
MRWIPMLLPLVLAACGGAPQSAAPAAAVPEPPRLDFSGKRPIPVRLDMLATADGGRAVAIAGAWRGEFEFDGGDRTRCGIERGELAEIAPGSSHEVRLICTAAVRLPDDGSRGFRMLEDGAVIASGTVLP